MKSGPQLKLWVVLFALIAESAFAGIEVTDDFDRRVVLEFPASRIVSLSPHNTENLFSAGLGDRIVGVDEYSQYPSAASEIPSVGSSSQVNIEAIIALEPDLIVVWQTATNKGKLEKLSELGYVLYYSEPGNFEDIIENILDLAVLGDTQEKISSHPQKLRQEIAELKEEYAGVSIQSVFYQIWSDPLITLNGDHFITKVLKICGAENVFSDLSIIAPRVSVESVIEANPDVIITGNAGDATGELSMWEPWKSITAVAKSNYVYVNSDVMHRHTARMIMGIRKLCIDLDATR